VRVNGEEDVAAVRSLVTIPIIGIRKVSSPDALRFITPTFGDAEAVAAAGADIIALDATARPRPGGERLNELIPRIKRQLGRPVMADVSTLDEGEHAAALGADLLATTLSGYTETSLPSDEPDLGLVRNLARSLSVPVVAEGRYRTPEDALEAFRAGAFAVVVGRAITDALVITRTFVEAIQEFRQGADTSR
jgi:N-acylglucosamine-6-phosphate 2-epimerase